MSSFGASDALLESKRVLVILHPFNRYVPGTVFGSRNTKNREMILSLKQLTYQTQTLKHDYKNTCLI